MSQFIYTMKGLGKTYPPHTVVFQDIWLSFLYDAKIGVIGSNGAGKSTFLNAVSGEQRVDSGTIEIDGIDMTRQPVWARARHVARVFQDPLAGTCEDLTIEENMALAKMRGERRGFSFAVKPALREEFRAQLATLGLGLENRLSDRIGLLSGGQRQAVSLLMAALQPSRQRPQLRR